MTHEATPHDEHNHGPEYDDRLPDATSVPVYGDPADSDRSAFEQPELTTSEAVAAFEDERANYRSPFKRVGHDGPHHAMHAQPDGE